MFQESQQELSYHLGSELPEHPFCPILLVKQVTKASPVLRGKKTPPLHDRNVKRFCGHLESGRQMHTVGSQQQWLFCENVTFTSDREKEALMIRELLIGWFGLEKGQRRLLGG